MRSTDQKRELQDCASALRLQAAAQTEALDEVLELAA